MVIFNHRYVLSKRYAITIVLFLIKLKAINLGHYVCLNPWRFISACATPKRVEKIFLYPLYH